MNSMQMFHETANGNSMYQVHADGIAVGGAESRKRIAAFSSTVLSGSAGGSRHSRRPLSGAGDPEEQVLTYWIFIKLDGIQAEHSH